MFNSNVRGRLDAHVVGPYELDAEGCHIVVAANEALPDEYFAHLDFPVSDFWNRYFRSKIEIVPPAQFNDILDVCCGTGTLCLNVMQKNMFVKCMAIDNSAHAIKRLSERIERENIRNVTALYDDVTRPAFQAESFDVIAGNSFLHHLPDNPGFLREMYRLLRPGGTICFTGEPTVASNVLENVLMGSAVRVAELIGVKRRRQKEARRLTDIWVYEKDKLTRLLQACGFTQVTITPFGLTVPLFNSLTAYLRTIASRPSLQPDLYWKALGAVDQYAFFWLPADWHSHFVISGRKPNGGR